MIRLIDDDPPTQGGGEKDRTGRRQNQPAETARYHPGRRRHKRIPVEWPARIELGQSLIVGTVRDATPAGLCFEPEVAYIDGAFVHGAEALGEFGVGDSIEVCLVRPEDGGAESVTCAVRWSGRSQAHDCWALGLERAELLAA
jgi:hypothetical protein